MLIRHLIGWPLLLAGTGLMGYSRRVPRAKMAATGSDWRWALPGFAIAMTGMAIIG
ncbi:hypothetical protein OG455_00215 [Kitasatospora sp. NBC_01287]|uniref:hypothetical protein n=1 Tax=Kitasatospora sp. NBC_01287 TaxID=2903573 RepID=UPI0022589B01|nr:hypothetical protein [Kitasatospora sp. NBC_01287]MCX4743950.1 hypothetical protein [Kitasatospora sp. NBC_01287]